MISLKRHGSLIALLALAFVVRAFHWTQWARDAEYGIPVADSIWFHETAQRIADGDLLAGNDVFFFGPLYAYALAPLYALFGANVVIASAGQALLGVINVGLVYALGRRLATPAVGWVAGLLLSVYGVAIYYEGLLLMETLLATLLTLGLWLAGGDWPRREKVRFLLAGIAFGLAATGRPSLLLPIAGLAIWQLEPWCPGQRLARVRRALPLYAGVAIVIALPVVRNLIVERELVPITSSGGFNLYLGNGPESNGTMAVLLYLPEDNADGGKQFVQKQLGRTVRASEVSRFWRARTMEHVAKNPAQALGLIGRKIGLFFNGNELPQIEWYEFDRNRFTVLSWPLVGTALVSPLALGFLIFGWRLPAWRPLLIFVSTYALSISLFFVNTRYRISVLPLLCLLAAGMLLLVVQAAKQRSVRELAAYAVVLPLLVAWTRPGRLLIDRDHLISIQHHRQAFRYEELERHQEALEQLDMALRLDPTNVWALAQLGRLYREDERYDESAQMLARAMTTVPENAEHPYALAITLHKAQRPGEAWRAIQLALSLAPYDARFHEYAGLILAAQGRVDEASVAFGRSVELGPDRASIYLNMGVLMGSQSRHPEAQALFRRAVELDPDYVAARRNLALSALHNGDPAAAREQAQWLMKHDPADRVAQQVMDAAGPLP